MSSKSITHKPAKQSKIDIKRALALALQGNTYADIARIMGVTKQGIQKQLSPLMKLMGNPDQLRAYQANKADILEGLQMQLAGSIVDADKIKKANLGNIAYAMKNLNDMLRLERDQSTSNVAVAHANAVKTIEEVDKEIDSITKDIQQVGQSEQDTGSYDGDVRLGAIDEEIERIASQGIDIPDDIAEDDSNADG